MRMLRGQLLLQLFAFTARISVRIVLWCAAASGGRGSQSVYRYWNVVVLEGRQFPRAFAVFTQRLPSTLKCETAGCRPFAEPRPRPLAPTSSADRPEALEPVL